MLFLCVLSFSLMLILMLMVLICVWVLWFGELKWKSQGTSFRVGTTSSTSASILSPNWKFFLYSHFQFVWFYRYKQNLWQAFGAHLRYNNVLLTPLTLLMFSLSGYTILLSSPCYPTLAESIVGSCAYRPNTQTSTRGKGDQRNKDFYSMFCAPLRSILSQIIYFLYKVSSVQLFLVLVVEFQRALRSHPFTI